MDFSLKCLSIWAGQTVDVNDIEIPGTFEQLLIGCFELTLL